MKGFELSTDYDLLFELIKEGYRIPAWIIYTNKYETPIYDLVEVKQRYKIGGYSIGVRGHGFGEGETVEELTFDCVFRELKFINPEL